MHSSAINELSDGCICVLDLSCSYDENPKLYSVSGFGVAFVSIYLRK